jgi:hypothetical protein
VRITVRSTAEHGVWHALTVAIAAAAFGQFAAHDQNLNPESFSSSLQVIAGIAARSLARSAMAARPRLSASSTRSRNLLLGEFGVSIASQKYVQSPSSSSLSVIWAKKLRQSKLFTLRT